MIIFSVAQATRHLGIDAKTLHRWLQEAQLPLLNFPDDARKKAVSQEHLHQLARLHHRHLPAFLQAEPPVLPAEPEPWTPLHQRLDALQTQVAALQQQITDLTCLLQAYLPAPTTPLPPSQDTKVAKPPAKPSVPRTRATTSATPKPPAKPVHVIARVEYAGDGHYAVICPKKGLLPFVPDTPEWFAWVTEQESFRFVGKEGHFSAHHEWRVPKGAWRAHRHLRNHLYTLRLAPNHELTLAVLEHAAKALQAHLA